MNVIIADVAQYNISGTFAKFELIAGVILGVSALVCIAVWVLEKTGNDKFLK